LNATLGKSINDDVRHHWGYILLIFSFNGLAMNSAGIEMR